jgi:hypothetical protein
MAEITQWIDEDEIEREVIPDMDPDTSYLEEEGEFADRLAAYRRGEFGYVGVRATVNVPVGGVTQTITSAGLWGIEDDSDEEYMNKVFREEKEQLIGILDEMGIGVETD